MCFWNRQERACAGGTQVRAARRVRDYLPFWICCSTSFISHQFSACSTLIIHTYLGLLTTDQGGLGWKRLPKGSIMWKQFCRGFTGLEKCIEHIFSVSCWPEVTVKDKNHHYTGALPSRFSRCYFNDNVIQPCCKLLQKIPQHFSELLLCSHKMCAFLIPSYHQPKLPSANTFSQTQRD